MPYVQRDAHGEILSLHRNESPAADEFLPSGHADIRNFVDSGSGPEVFGKLDADFVRVIEDVIDTLIVKNVMNITDLPSEVQSKLFARKSFRDQMSRNALNLFGDATPQGMDDIVKDTGFSDL